MKKPLLLTLSCIVLLCITRSIHAQSGCTDSPENPTAVLAIVGCAGAFFTSARRRLKARRRSTEK
jgi:XrtJ-associated TM-motif-TM protein